MGSKDSASTDSPPPVFSDAGQSYLNRYQDVGAAELDPWAHYNEYGQNEGRLWGNYTQAGAQDYLNRYADVRNAGVNPFEHYQNFGINEGRTFNPNGIAQDPVASFMDNFMAQQQEAAAANRAAAEEAQANLERQREEDRRTFGENNRDAAYNNYLSAAGSATDYVNTAIENERANARLSGTKYEVTEEGKANRISEYFGTLWSDGDQTNLEGLFEEWGEVDGFEGFSVTRSDATGQSEQGAVSRQVSASSGRKANTGVGGTSRKRGTLATGQNELGTLSTLGGA